MPDSLETKRTEWIVLGKLGDHVKKMIELELLIEKEPQFKNSVAPQLQALQEVIANWPMPESSKINIRYTIIALADSMRGLTQCDEDMFAVVKEVKSLSDQGRQLGRLIMIISQYKYLKENAKNLLSHINTIGE